ncbi:hypothetical protein TNCV_4682431 [Trichonephila clavipes]|nr:hypothetical protein TNCV_4682431 [Trichonephila clavipes]
MLFLLIYRKARAGELDLSGGLSQLALSTEINVDEAGVGGAKHFFEAKIASFKFEEEIRAEQERKREDELKRKRLAAFKEKVNFFGQDATQS